MADCDPAKGGVIEGVLRLGDALTAMGHTQDMLTLDAPDDPWVASSTEPVFAMGKSISPKRFYPAKAIRWLSRHVRDYDFVIVDGLWNSATLAAARVLPSVGVPYAVFPHGMLDPWFRKLQPMKEWVKRQAFRINERGLLRGATAVLFTSEQERILARESWPGWIGINEQVVGFGTGEPPAEAPAMRSAFESAVPGVGGRPYLLFLSRIHQKKGCEVLLQALAKHAALSDWQIVIAGPGEPGYVAELQGLGAALGLSARLHWPGMLASDAKWGALYGCEAMVLTSHQENFGVVVAEALACSRPVLISDQVNIHAAVTQGNAGWVCQDNAASAADALRNLLSQPAGEREAAGARGRSVFEQEFTMHRVAERIIDIFSDRPNG